MHQQQQQQQKKSKGGPQTEVHHYEAEMGIYFSSLYNAWRLHSRRSDMPVCATWHISRLWQNY
jgi:hypothetical protein